VQRAREGFPLVVGEVRDDEGLVGRQWLGTEDLGVELCGLPEGGAGAVDSSAPAVGSVVMITS
jgi:hypothetical protein